MTRRSYETAAYRSMLSRFDIPLRRRRIVYRLIDMAAVTMAAIGVGLFLCFTV